MGRKAEEEDDYDGVPRKCGGCRKPVLDGRGNQRQRKSGKVERFCDRCWKTRSEEKW